MRFITFEEINNLHIAPSLCYDWAVSMIKNKKDSLLPPKISLKPRDGVFCNVMPSIIPQDVFGHVGGVKVVTRYSNREPSLESELLLMDAETGKFLAFMDGTWITTMRTGAVAAHSIMLLGKENYSTIGMMGLGNTVRATLEILETQIPDRELYIKLLKYKNQESDFQKRFSQYENLHFSFVDTPEEMIKGSDVVVSGATYLPNDVCEDKYFDEGVLVVPIHTLGFTNCDLFFDKVFADDYGHVHHFKNFDKFKSFAEVCDVVNGNVKGRENSSERILAYNIGISIHDMNFAANIYHMLSNSVLEEIDLKQPVEKFWV